MDQCRLSLANLRLAAPIVRADRVIYRLSIVPIANLSVCDDETCHCLILRHNRQSSIDPTGDPLLRLHHRNGRIAIRQKILPPCNYPSPQSPVCC